MPQTIPIKADQKLGTAWSLRQHVSGAVPAEDWNLSFKSWKKSEKLLEKSENLRKTKKNLETHEKNYRTLHSMGQ